MKIESKTNRLINEKSPYLLQHAYNPVNWYSWCDEAFEKAKKENKPIFLSIGYSTCHWCHVMEHECFEDDEVASKMNEKFVCIKVDREERPDIDSVYMTVCQSLTGGGGWPLSVFITPNANPFYAGTYFPKYSKYNMPGFLEILDTMSLEWKNNSEKIEKASLEFMREISEEFDPEEYNEDVSFKIVEDGYEFCKKIFDGVYGGFGKEPKFPTPHKLLFLLNYYKITSELEALNMVEKTLEGMYRGGIFDHVGFGFSRYSTDEKWLVPHFEKMLYDNALLIIAYLECYELTKKDFYKDVAIKTIDYVLREFKGKENGFYSAQDADSDGHEGKFYVFNPLEICEVLGDDDGKRFNDYFDITPSGNFEGKSIANLLYNNGFESGNEEIDKLREKVFKYRNERTNLHTDDKILTSWNALMIVALSKAYETLKNYMYLNAAENAIDFIKGNLINEKGRLLARFRDGEAKYLAYLEDYAFLVWAFIEMYESTDKEAYLKDAIKFTNNMIDKFWEENKGGFFLYGNDAEKLILRPKELYDGAIPSGNSVAAYVLLKLSEITQDEKLKEYAKKQIRYFFATATKSPISYTMYLNAVIEYLK